MYKSFDVKVGTIAYDKEEKLLFPTEQEAEEYFRDKEENEDSSN